ncbi:hypothetical protein C7212DRAFT_348232 [Tuber magnatum]|uniref:Uncharacterized protein n=1 Tax=Tuber magnatum TaxID=42249 RepID=A0A317SCV4_9PEZI|nr:hypothetical protein C7212DRAFT_348232 [Tuber magnatum]
MEGLEEESEGEVEIKVEKDLDMDLGKGKTRKGRGLGDSKFGVKSEWEFKSGLKVLKKEEEEVRRRKRVIRAEKKKKVEVWEDEGEVVEEEGGGLVEKWRMGKVMKEKREKKMRKEREREGMILSGEERDMSREEMFEVKRELEDGKDMIDSASYILGTSREEAVGFGVKLALRRVERLMMGEVRVEMEKIGEGKRVVVKEERVKRKEEEVKLEEKKTELEGKRVVEGGRSYGRVARGIGPGMKGKEIVELEAKKRLESELEKERVKKREEREVLSMKVGLDSQEVGKEVDWDKEQWERELSLEKGSVVEVSGVRNRLRVVVGMKEDLSKGIGVCTKWWEKMVEKKVKELRRID